MNKMNFMIKKTDQKEILNLVSIEIINNAVHAVFFEFQFLFYYVFY